MDATDKTETKLWDDAAFVARVETLAAARGTTVRELCKKAGLDATYLAHPAGKTGRGGEALLRLARELNVGVADLIEPQDDDECPVSPDSVARLVLVADIAAHLLVALRPRARLVQPAAGSTRLVGEILKLIETAA